MSLGEVWWFFDRVPQSGVEGLFRLLRAHGIHDRHPGDGLIYVLDDDGTRRSIQLDLIFREWIAPGVLTMQFWLDADTDVIVTAESGGRCVTFDLDGSSLAQARTIISALVLCACVLDETRVLVVDRSLPDSGEEWRSATSSEPLNASYEPDLLVTVGSGNSRVVRMGRASWLRE
jgi:hypothetical protein